MKTLSIISRILIAALLVAVFVQEWQSSRERKVEEQLRTNLEALIESYKAGTVDVIDISAITPFAWEKLYLFGPYTSEEIISEVTDIKRLGNLPTWIESDDGIVLFVFVNEGKIVRYMNVYRNTDFASADRRSGYSPSEAVFILDERGRAIPLSP
jgi:hypothetical protein